MVMENNYNISTFENGRVLAQYRSGGSELKKEITYHCPMQLILTDNNDPDEVYFTVNGVVPESSMFEIKITDRFN